MKSRYTRQLLVIFAVFISNLLFGNIGKGYLITLDGKSITGKILDVYYSEWYASLTFENDFGNSYSIHPATIHGFVWRNKNQEVVFESKYVKGKWLFLRVIERGPGLTMYRTVDRSTKVIKVSDESLIADKKIDEVWLQFYKKRPFQLFRVSFKKVLKKKLAAFPDLANKIGKPGYKYRDLAKIVTLYNELYTRGDIRM